MNRFFFYIDGAQIQDEPIGMDGFQASIERDEGKRFIGVTFPLDLTFIGDGYTAIKDYIKDNNRYSYLDFEIRELQNGNLSTVYAGLIKLSEGTDYISRRKWETPIRDQSFSAYLLNNWETPVNIEGTETRRGAGITPTTSGFLYRSYDRSQYNHDISGSTGVSSIDDDRLKFYDAQDALQYILHFLSENRLTLQSSWFDGLNNDEHLGLIGGIEAHYRTGAPIVTTLGDLIHSLTRLYNLWWTVSGSIFILEEESYFENATPIVSLIGVDEYEASFDELSLYQSISVGDPIGGDIPVRNNLHQIGPNVDYFLARELFMDTDGASSASIDLQPKYIINSPLLYDMRNRLGNWSFKLEKHVLTPNDNIDFSIGYLPRRDVNGYYDWLDQRFIEHVFLVQYKESEGEIFIDSTNDGRNFMGGHVHFNDAVLARYNFGGDLYLSEEPFSSFRIFNNSDDSGFLLADESAFSNVSWYNDDNAGIYGLNGGGNIVDDGSNIYYKARTTETKKFSFSVQLSPRIELYQDEIRFNQFGMFSQTDKTFKCNISQALTTDPLIFITDKDTIGIDSGTEATVEFFGTPGMSDWWQSVRSIYNANTGEGGLLEDQTISKLSSKAFSIPVDATGFTTSPGADFWGGEVTFFEGGTNGLTDVNAQCNVDLKLIHYSDGQASELDSHTETFTNVRGNVTLTCENEFTLADGDEVFCQIKITTGADASTNWYYLPLEFRDNKSELNNLYTSSPANYRGEILTFEHALTPTERNDILLNPHKAISLPEGKGWPQKIDINLKTGKASFSLLTNSTYFNADGDS